MTRTEFEKLAKSMGYADEKTIKKYCDGKEEGYVFEDSDFIHVNRMSHQSIHYIYSGELRTIGDGKKLSKRYKVTNRYYE